MMQIHKENQNYTEEPLPPWPFPKVKKLIIEMCYDILLWRRSSVNWTLKMMQNYKLNVRQSIIMEFQKLIEQRRMDSRPWNWMDFIISELIYSKTRLESRKKRKNVIYKIKSNKHFNGKMLYEKIKPKAVKRKYVNFKIKSKIHFSGKILHEHFKNQKRQANARFRHD